ncbi:MAG TPA: NFACT RNA binding domain-containing protein [Parachlamydiaceae bacterium]|nr:NFACT RNA binding domain-containing protein [Parachlamydiaceae bacterium]
MDTLDPSQIAFEKKKAQIKKKLQREMKRILKTRENFEESLKKAHLFEEKRHEGDLLKTYFQKLKRGMDVVTVLDWEKDQEVKIKLDPLLEPKNQVASFFKKAKKLKLSIPHQQRQIIKLTEKLGSISKELENLELLTTLKELESLYPVKIKEKQEKPQPYREFISDTGFKILVGRNSRCNDALTFQYAKGNDLWLHVKDYPGSHVVIVRRKGQEIDQATIAQAAGLACFYSKAKDAPYAEVCLTECKYVSRIGKKRDGKVQISKQKTILHTLGYV